MTTLSEISAINRMETIESLIAKIAKVKKERAELAELNWQLYDQFDHVDAEGEREMEARMWAQECIHIELEHQLLMLRLAKRKAAAAAAAPPANPPAHSQHPDTSETQPAALTSDPAASQPKVGLPVEPI